MGANPIFASTPKIGAANISTANTNRDGTGTIGTVLTAGASGSRITKITIKATGVTTAGMVRLFLYDGAAYHLWYEVAIPAVTPSATVQAAMVQVGLVGESALHLPSGWSLRASTHNAEAFEVIAEGADF